MGSVMGRKRRRKISTWKLGLGAATGGLSLFFTGLHKKNHSASGRAKAKRRIRAQAKPRISPPRTRSVPPTRSSAPSPIVRTDLQNKTITEILQDDGMKWMIPKLTIWGWAVAVLAAYIFISAFAWVSIILLFIEYCVLIEFSKQNVLYAKPYIKIGARQVYTGPYLWECDQSSSINTVPNDELVDQHAMSMQKVDAMDGHAFEYFVAELLKKLGYSNVSVTRGSGDQGVDVLAEKDGIRYAVQCKNYSSALGNTPVQEVSAGKEFYNCHVGVVITNNYFTKGAKELAERTRVLLWDRDKLSELMAQASSTV